MFCDDWNEAHWFLIIVFIFLIFILGLGVGGELCKSEKKFIEQPTSMEECIAQINNFSPEREANGIKKCELLFGKRL